MCDNNYVSHVHKHANVNVTWKNPISREVAFLKPIITCFSNTSLGQWVISTKVKVCQFVMHWFLTSVIIHKNKNVAMFKRPKWLVWLQFQIPLEMKIWKNSYWHDSWAAIRFCISRIWKSSDIRPSLPPLLEMQFLDWNASHTSIWHTTMCKIAYFAGQMGGYNLNKVNGFLASRDYT